MNEQESITSSSKFESIAHLSRFFQSFSAVLFFSSSFSAFSFTSFYEIIEKQNGKNIMSSSLHLILNFWFEKTECSRTNYSRLKKILRFVKFSTDDIDNLFFKLNSLKRQIRRHIFLLQLIRKIVTIVIDKQFSLFVEEKKRRKTRIVKSSWHYWYDSIDLIRTIFCAIELRRKMYFDMTFYVDESTELWKSKIWNSFIKTTFENVAYIRQNHLIISENIVHFRFQAKTIFRRNKMIFINKNHKSNANVFEKIMFILQSIVNRAHYLFENFEKLIFENENTKKMCLIENRNLCCKINFINRHVNIYFDRKYDVNENVDEAIYENNKYFIRRIINLNFHVVRSLQYMHSIRKELKIQQYEREYLKKTVTKSHISFSYLLFIDDFDVHRNMYRFLKAFYIISTCLFYVERRKIINVFTFTLKFHEVDMQIVVKVFRRFIQKFDKKLNMKVNDSMKIVFFFVMIFLNDMSQQANNEEFFRHFAMHDCRTCFCSKKNRNNFDFDTIDNDRTHLHTLFFWKNMKHMNDVHRRIHMKEADMKFEFSVIMQLTSSFDFIQSRAYDAFHSKWKSFDRIFHSFLLSFIFSKRRSASYLKSFQTFFYFSDWFKIQSSTFYIWSWSLIEIDRATLFVSLILRNHVIVEWFRLSYLQTTEKIFSFSIISLRVIIKVFDIIARANTLMNNQRYTSSRNFHRLIFEVRHAYQDLIKCAIKTEEDFVNEVAKDVQKNDDAIAIDDILSNAVHSKFEFENELIQSDSSKNKTKQKNRSDKKSSDSRFNKLLIFFNVHAELHLIANAKKMTTVMNFNVFADELKHMWLSHFYFCLNDEWHWFVTQTMKTFNRRRRVF